MRCNPLQLPSGNDEIIDVEAYNSPRQNVSDLGGGLLALFVWLGPLLILAIPCGAIWAFYVFLVNYK